MTFTPQGSVAYSDKGQGGTLKDVALVVSDSRADGTGTLAVTVRSPGSVPIIADPFAVLAYQGQEVTVSPLAHVRGGTGTVRLSNVPAKADATITPDFQGGTFRFASDQVGTHNLEYTVTDGVLTATGTIRIDVKAPPGAKTAADRRAAHRVHPRADDPERRRARDRHRPVGRRAPGHGRRRRRRSRTGVRVEILGQRILRVTLNRPLDAPVDFHYRISNGLAETEGTVTVVQLPPLTIHQPPIANPDTVSVRVGDVVDIPVLANDVQPDGDKLTLDPTLATPLPAGAGLLFASRRSTCATSRRRSRATSPPSTGSPERTDSGPPPRSASRSASATRRRTTRRCRRPSPPASSPATRCASTIPLSGIDPDGDSVQLIGQETNPEKGAVHRVGDRLDGLPGRRLRGGHRHVHLRRGRRARRPRDRHRAGRDRARGSTVPATRSPSRTT